MQEEYVELIPEGLTRGVSLQEAYFLMLREKDGERFLPSLLEKEEFEQISLAMNQKEYPGIRLMSRLASRFSILLDSVHIFYPPRGNLSATLLFMQDGDCQKMPCNIAEGITAALGMQRPIFMQRSMFEEQMLRQQGEGQVSMPITAMNYKLLQEALKAAVSEENFELASVLRDELKHRDTLNNGTSEQL